MEGQTPQKEYRSRYIQTTNKYGTPIYIPVVDVRDGDIARQMAEAMLKASNQSRYMTYNRYHQSYKKTNTL